MIKMILLICAASIAREDCSADTAKDVIMGPLFDMPTACALYGMAQLASTSMVSEGHYLKVLCARQEKTDGKE